MSGVNGTDSRGHRGLGRPGAPGSEGLDTPGSLAQLVEEIVDQLADVRRTDGDDETGWQRAGRVFAALSGGALEVRLQPPVARAALRTPDTLASTRGEGWLRFAPPLLDRFAADRVAAWLESAWRHAAD
jgi:hypothetical protein